MIALENVSLLKPGYTNRDPILVDANAVFDLGEKVGILAAPGTGKSSIARLLAGIDRPDQGSVRHTSAVNGPIGFAGFLHPNLRVGDNLNIFARLKGVATESVVEFCQEFCGVANLVDKKTQDLSPTQRAMLGYACTMSVPGPAMWIADEVITIGEPRDRARCDEVLASRFEQGGLVFLSRNARQLNAYCDRFLLLINQRLVECDDLSVGQAALDLTLNHPAPSQMRSQYV